MAKTLLPHWFKIQIKYNKEIYQGFGFPEYGSGSRRAKIGAEKINNITKFRAFIYLFIYNRLHALIWAWEFLMEVYI